LLYGNIGGNNFAVKIADLSFESSQKPLVDLIKEFKPDIVGISCLTQNYLQALKLAGTAKKINDDCIVVFGGIHTTYKWKEILNCPDVDMAILGEGEQAMLELCQTLDTKGDSALRKIKGLAYRKRANNCK
jgi:anaerobic magnesium-protoporphyrin IX monomethyl ester cyclase